jgi:formyltetrahydrofolate deformylase
MSQKTVQKSSERSATLLIHCPDKKGIVYFVTDFLYKNNGNILYLDQYVDAQGQMFFMRVEWDLKDFSIAAHEIAETFSANIAEKFKMKWKLSFSDELPRMAIFVSKLSHCLYDVLSRCQSGEWQVEVPLIISNHPDLEGVAQNFGIEFHHMPMTKENKPAQEEKQLALLKEKGIDFIVLARYMQILSDSFVSHYPNRIINIHHAFLPAFPGAKPYHMAHKRGVKIIGATSHYVTAQLDEGPIIAQDVTPVSHNDSIEDLVRKGRDLEKIVFARAIWNHIQQRVLVYENRTVIFA